MKSCTRFFSIGNSFKQNPVEENFELKQFQIKLDNQRIATVSYEKVDDNTYDLVYSSIPEEYQGKGFGHILAERVFDELVRRNKKIKLSCDFLQQFFEENRRKYNSHVIN